MKTFVVRLWSPAGEVEGHALSTLRGTVEPVGAGVAEPFKDSSELLRLLRSALGRGDGDEAREEAASASAPVPGA